MQYFNSNRQQPLRMARPTGLSLLLIPIVSLFSMTSHAADTSRGRPISFRHDVMALLSKSGCNAGICHGNANGKGGFKLSLRGDDPSLDFQVLTRSQFGRRINLIDPADSILLRKPTTSISHRGGKRFNKDSNEYRILYQWIADGAPADAKDLPKLTSLIVSPMQRVLKPNQPVQIKATALFSNGQRRDVTRLAVYEPTDPMLNVTPQGMVRSSHAGQTTVLVRYLHNQQAVRLWFVPPRPDFTFSAPEPKNLIDRHVFKQLHRLRMNPSEVCDDSVFVRRLFLDLLGILPPAEEARQFVADTSKNKRSSLIDKLLKRPEFADQWALRWSDLLRNEEKLLDRKGVPLFHQWIRKSMADAKPIDQFVRQLLTARGSTYKNPPANYYRALRQPNIRAESIAQVFLGTRLQCAKCHNHPFERWTQDDYYGFAANFARINYKIIENKRKDKNDKKQFIGEQIVQMADKGEVQHARTGKTAHPSFLGADAPKLGPKDDRLEPMARWLTSPDNPLFAKVMVNRIWHSMMGRGLVDPVDDFRATNPASHPALLAELAQKFVESNYNLRHIVRLIANSQTYQLSSTPNSTNRDDRINASHTLIRRLTAEQLVDAIGQATSAPVKFNGYDPGIRAGQLPGVNKVYRDGNPSPGDRFLTLFGKPPRLLNCQCERTNETALGQVFELCSGPLIHQMLTTKDNRLDKLLKANKGARFIVKELYWATLSRSPNDHELKNAVKHLEKAGMSRTALEDVTWSLLNAKEFILRR